MGEILRPARIVLILEDDPIIARQLGRILSKYQLHTVTAATLSDGLRVVASRHPPVCSAVIDVGLPDGSGLEAARALRRADADAPILVLTGDCSPPTINAANREAVEFAVKPVPAENIHAWALRIANMSPARPTADVIGAFATAKALSRREHEILTLITSGALRCSLAARLGVAESTVKTHIKDLLRKSGSHETISELALALLTKQ